MAIVMLEGPRGKVSIYSRDSSLELNSHGSGDQILHIVKYPVPVLPHVPCYAPQFVYNSCCPTMSCES